MHTLTARALKRTHWLYEPERFVPAAQLVDTYGTHAQHMTGTHGVAYSSAVSTGTTTVEPQLYYIHTDHLGTPQELTDSDGNLQWVGQYRAWGELAKANDSEGNAASVEMPLRFQGQYFDAETGLHYNRFRYYDPQIGRFTTQDPISLAGGINLYQYAPNPVQWVDPLGLSGKKIDRCPKEYKSKTAEEMADDLYGDLNKNSVTYSTPDKMGNIDINGRAHFDKATNTKVDVPHVQESPVNIAPDGRRFPMKKQEVVTPATKQDIRIARRLAQLKGML